MFVKLEIVRLAQAMARHAGARTEVIAQNVANADTPGFRSRDLPDFAAHAQGQGLRTTHARHLRGAETASFDPIITDRRGAASPSGNTVSLEEEMVKAVSAKQQHDMALSIYQNSSRILRTSLGKAS